VLGVGGLVTPTHYIGSLINIKKYDLNKKIKLQNNLFTNPLEQFEIRDYVTIDMPILFNTHLSFNNMIEYLLKSFLIIILFNIMTTKINKVLYKY
jgi:hypothetical protein